MQLRAEAQAAKAPSTVKKVKPRSVTSLDMQELVGRRHQAIEPTMLLDDETREEDERLRSISDLSEDTSGFCSPSASNLTASSPSASFKVRTAECFCTCHFLPVHELIGKHTVEQGDGVLLEGEWTNGKMNGNGTLHSDKLGSYAGEWLEGMIHGKGTFYFLDGQIFEGLFVRGNPTSGFMKRADGARDLVKFDGTVSIFDPHLQAHSQTSEAPRNSTPDVQPKSSEQKPSPAITIPPLRIPAEKAETRFPTRCSCHGSSVKDIVGKHTVEASDGRFYLGEWQDGLWHGKGKWEHPTIGSYIGEWHSGVFHGTGKFCWYDGSKRDKTVFTSLTAS
eukprot:753587-Hanusia_phi.AAC.2